MYRFATGVPARYAGLLCVCTGSLQEYLNDMLAYFAEEAETIARMAHYLKDDIIYVREYAYGIDTDNYYDYYDNYKVNFAVIDWEGRGPAAGGSFPHCCHLIQSIRRRADDMSDYTLYRSGIIPQTNCYLQVSMAALITIMMVVTDDLWK